MTDTQAIPYFDLKRQTQSLKKDLETAASRILESGQYILSSEVEDFEKEFAAYSGVAHAIGVGSGTDALILSLKAAGVTQGDEVILPSFTFIATAFAVIHLHATPVLADVNPETFNLDPDSILKACTSKTKAILPVHLFGQTASMGQIRDIAKSKHLKVIEDACQAHGAMHHNQKSGALGDAGCFSFYPTKNLGGTGDGGLITTNDAELAHTLRRFRNLGRETMRSPHETVGWTTRLDGLQAALLRIKLKHLNTFNSNRRAVADQYLKDLSKTPLRMPLEAERNHHVYHLFVVRVPDGKRDSLQKFLGEQGVPTAINYAIPVHEQPSCKPFVSKPGKLPVTDLLKGEVLSLPMFPEMTSEEVGRVTSAINRFYGS